MKKRPIALTIAGSDCGGGAGIQADLNTFSALGAHGTTAIACLTAQNPRTVLAAAPVDPDFIREQLIALFDQLPPAAVKTGMLFNAVIIETVFQFLKKHPTPLVVDPVMIATSGAHLLEPDAVDALTKLFPLSAVITPNLDEASALLGRKLTEPEHLRAAAREIHTRYGCAALVKGGHLRGLNEAIDIFYDGNEELLLSAPYIKGVQTHGTGCTYSAAIAAWLAHGVNLKQAISRAKEYMSKTIADSRRIGRHQVLGWI